MDERKRKSPSLQPKQGSAAKGKYGTQNGELYKLEWSPYHAPTGTDHASVISNGRDQPGKEGWSAEARRRNGVVMNEMGSRQPECCSFAKQVLQGQTWQPIERRARPIKSPSQIHVMPVPLSSSLPLQSSMVAGMVREINWGRWGR